LLFTLNRLLVYVREYKRKPDLLTNVSTEQRAEHTEIAETKKLANNVSSAGPATKVAPFPPKMWGVAFTAYVVCSFSPNTHKKLCTYLGTSQ